jgi:hypothetical protein
MTLPEIQGQKNLSGNYFYFGCDHVYFNEYGKPLALSLRKHAPWAKVHCHLFNPTDEQLVWCDLNNVSLTYEIVDDSIFEIKTYYACVRFIRIPEIFEKSSRIISLDCDSIVIAPLSQDKFLEDTNETKVFWRTKGNKSLASLIIFGTDEKRYRYADNLKEHFINDTFKWFLDQDVLDDMISKNQFGITTDVYWGSTGKKKTSAIWSGKGDRKFDQEFQRLIKEYKG